MSTSNKASDFILVNAEGKERSLKDYRGKWLVLYFYPKDDTPGCTVEAQDFTRMLPDFSSLGVTVVGVSPDSPESHCRFIDKYSLNLELLSDPDRRALVEYGAWGTKKNYGKEYEGVIRSTFLINPEGVLVQEWKNVRAKGHAERVYKEVQTQIGS